MANRPDTVTLGLATLVAVVALSDGVGAESDRPADGAGLFDAFELGGRKGPITITADGLEYDYKSNIVVYRGDVLATQDQVKLRSDTLTVTFASQAPGNPPAAGRGSQRVDQIVAVGKVRIDHGTRWATGGRAVFDQSKRTLVLSETPILHDGGNEVAGDRVIVYLDEDRSVVEGGRKRVKAVLQPGQGGSEDGPSASAAPLP
jgi:lipopolysaccharide export system protein LptA